MESAGPVVADGYQPLACAGGHDVGCSVLHQGSSSWGLMPLQQIVFSFPGWVCCFHSAVVSIIDIGIDAEKIERTWLICLLVLIDGILKVCAEPWPPPLPKLGKLGSG